MFFFSFFPQRALSLPSPPQFVSNPHNAVANLTEWLAQFDNIVRCLEDFDSKGMVRCLRDEVLLFRMKGIQLHGGYCNVMDDMAAILLDIARKNLTNPALKSSEMKSWEFVNKAFVSVIRSTIVVEVAASEETQLASPRDSAD
mmetsp:Transcript_27351/g.44012  ORF Transcript_27351/g.44012 Transcript_27351/m.44012 type:complete len:143 (-) Transcript_27351:142-570(-)